MPTREMNDAKHWRDRGAEMRVIADGFTDKKAAAMIRRLADDYDKMAERAEDRAKHGIHPARPSPMPKETGH